MIDMSSGQVGVSGAAYGPSTESLATWAAAWQRTAQDYRDIAAYELRASLCRDLPQRIRKSSAIAARKAYIDASECEVYAVTGVRY